MPAGSISGGEILISGLSPQNWPDDLLPLSARKLQGKAHSIWAVEPRGMLFPIFLNSNVFYVQPLFSFV